MTTLKLNNLQLKLVLRALENESYDDPIKEELGYGFGDCYDDIKAQLERRKIR